jgi:LAO/AO transport system kinase
VIGSAARLIDDIRRGDPRTVGKLISRIEAGDETVAPIIAELYRLGGVAPIIGITGPPGAGKSTLVDHLLVHYRERGSKVAVLAIDPSSPFSGGAILGDRVRMSRHNTDEGVFIRSMSARGRLGGLAGATGDALIVLGAMPVDAILVETVGVGQSEVEIMRHAETVLVVQTPTAGDGVQAVKAGVLEIADVIAVNKSDLPGADRAMTALRVALDMSYREGWRPPVMATRATEDVGIGELLATIEAHAGYLAAHPAARDERWRSRCRVQVLEHATELFRARHATATENARFEALLDEVVARKRDPRSAAVAFVA